MSGTTSRNKGQRGEREAIAIIQEWVNNAYAPHHRPPTLTRNLDQTRDGGNDMKGLEWLSLEIKRQEKPNLKAWWKQTIAQTKPGQLPFLMYRCNRQPWRVMTMVNPVIKYTQPVQYTGIRVELELSQAEHYLTLFTQQRRREKMLGKENYIDL